jgi:hypothetical protein
VMERLKLQIMFCSAHKLTKLNALMHNSRGAVQYQLQLSIQYPAGYVLARPMAPIPRKSNGVH